MSRTERLVLIIFVILFFTLIGLLIVAERNTHAMRAECESKGGVMFRSRESGSICIKKDVVL